MGGDLLALGDDLVGCHPQRSAADHRRARAGRAHAEGDPVRVAVDVLDFARLDAEALVQDLLKGGLVALALIFRAHEDGRGAAGVEADLREFEAR